MLLIFFYIRDPWGELRMNLEKPFLRYLNLNHQTHWEVEEITFEPNLMKQAELISWIRWIPRPPSNFGRQNLFWQTKFTFDFRSETDHKKFLKQYLIQSQTFFERGKTIAICCLHDQAPCKWKRIGAPSRELIPYQIDEGFKMSFTRRTQQLS